MFTMLALLFQNQTSINRKVSSIITLMVLVLVCAGCAGRNRPITPASGPISIESIERDGPVRGFVARIDLTDPRVRIRVVPATPDDPDGDGPCVTRLDKVQAIASRNQFDLAINASFFIAPASREIFGKTLHYFVSNPAFPLGWLMSNSRIVSRPQQHPSPAIVVFDDDRVEITTDLIDMPTNAREAVSGSEMLVNNAQVVARDSPQQHPRTAAGLSADRTELILVVIDGRRENWSHGVTLRELGAMMIELGANDAINLDGGGSSTMVERVSDGNYRILNRPSDGSEINPSFSIPRAVSDALGVQISP
ncbi:MAG TPA: phosphodiester glycosidase family protein [Tepidisphaeraceae bacterium]|nr:phosphodiester glycosidase family protein [Tepidisphaeraceae bacterium]